MKAITKIYKWEKVRNNYILSIDADHYISYDPNTDAGRFFGVFNDLIGSEDESGEETALVDRTNPDHKYRILVGDWRDAYEKLVPLGFEDCVDFFMENRQQHGGQWSTHEMDRRA